MEEQVFECLKQLAPLPPVERGYPYPLYANDKKGNRMIYTSRKSVVIRDMDDISEADCFAGEHKMNVKVATFAPSGNWVASGDEGGTVIVWGDKNHSVKATHEAIQECIDIAWDADGKRILVAGNGKPHTAKCIAWDSGNKLGDMGASTKKCISCDIRHVRPYRAVTSSEDNTVAFYEGPPFKHKSSDKKSFTRYPNKVKYSPDGEKYLSVGSDGVIVLYDGKTGELEKEIKSDDGHSGAIYSFAWSPDSKSILTASADKTAKVWDIENSTVTATYTFSDNPTLNDMQMSALWVKDHMVTLSLSGCLNYLDPANPSQPSRIVMGHKEAVKALAVDNNTKTFFTGDQEGLVCVWKDYVATWFGGEGHGKGIMGLAVNSDGSKLLSVGLDDGARWNDIETVQFGAKIKLTGCPRACAASPSDADVAVVTTNKSICVLKGDEVKSSMNIMYTAGGVQFLPKGDMVVVCADEGKNHIYTIEDDFSLKEVRTDESDRTKAAKSVKSSSAEANFYVSVGVDKHIIIKDADSGELKNSNRWEYHNAIVSDVCVNPSGTKIASVGMDLTIIVWEDLQTFEAKQRKEQQMSHRGGISFCEFVDDDTLITVGQDSFIKVWKV